MDLPAPCTCYDVVIDTTCIDGLVRVNCKKKNTGWEDGIEFIFSDHEELYYYENWIHCEDCAPSHITLVV